MHLIARTGDFSGRSPRPLWLRARPRAPGGKVAAMERDSAGQSTSVWMATAERRQQGGLNGDTKADVCVVGAGIAGMMTAYLLAREGKSVVVLDDGPIGGGQTERTTAHLSNAIDDRYSEIERLHGTRGPRPPPESTPRRSNGSGPSPATSRSRAITSGSTASCSSRPART